MIHDFRTTQADPQTKQIARRKHPAPFQTSNPYDSPKQTPPNPQTLHPPPKSRTTPASHLWRRIDYGEPSL